MIDLKDVYSYYGTPALALLHRLICERPAQANISNAGTPAWADHVEFVNSRPYRAWYIINADLPPRGFDRQFGWNPVGAIYATHQNEVGIAILKEHHRRGFAREALIKLVTTLQPLPAIRAQRVGYYIANVSPENEPSHALFEGLGCTLAQLTYRFPPAP